MPTPIKPEDLRVGNLIWDFEENTHFAIEEIRKDSDGFKGYYIVYRNGSFKLSIKVVEPIPLTEEWLLKLGFVKGITTYSKPSDLVVSLEFDWVGIYIPYLDDDIQLECPKHVHQLQNLYRALTGRELTFKDA